MDDAQLMQVARYAYKEVPFYSNLAKEKNICIDSIKSKENFIVLPLINKDMFQKGNRYTLSERYYSYPYSSRIMIRRTSGSTGKYLKIYWDFQDDIRSLIELWYNRKKYYGIHPRDKYCFFYTTEYNANKLVEEADTSLAIDKRSLGFSKNDLNKAKIIEICKKMYEFDPVYLLVQPSMAVLIMECMKENRLPRLRSLRYIELTGEMLLDTVRDSIENFFNCAVSNQYGCNETNCIASERGDGELYIHASNVYVEIIRNGIVVPDGECGDIYVTSLTNYAMPFIRYKTGDQGILGKKDGRQTLTLVKGRESQFIIDEERNKLPFYIFIRPIEHINEHLGTIVNQFQIVQLSINKFIVRFSINPSYSGWKKTIENLFISNIKQATLENAEWMFEYKDNLYPDNFTGKLSYFSNEMGE